MTRARLRGWWMRLREFYRGYPEHIVCLGETKSVAECGGAP
jgi:hypothetical protein